MLRLPYSWRKVEEKKSLIPHFGGVRYYADCFFENLYIRYAKLPTRGIYMGAVRDEKVIVSLTTFPARIDACFYAIKSLMLQTYQADRIVLWLAKEQFEDSSLLKNFSPLISSGLEIRYCDDLKSHKKYYYALQEQKPDEHVITFDDDIVYEKDAIEKLVIKHKQFPDAIVCNRGHYMPLAQDRLEPYRKWTLQYEQGVDAPIMAIMPSTGDGCLYPYGCMPLSTFDIKLMKANAWSADDIWMRFNSLNNGIKVVRTRKETAALCNVYSSQREALRDQNDGMGENQRTVDRLLRLFPNTERILAEDFIASNNVD